MLFRSRHMSQGAVSFLIRTLSASILFVIFFIFLINTQIYLTLFLILFTYLLLSTTIHPWYITPLIALSPFVKTRSAIVWSFTVFLSYASYQWIPVKEVFWLVVLEYICVFAYLFWEWRTDKI